MSRKEHRIKALESMYDNLFRAKADAMAHGELSDLCNEIEALRSRVSKILDAEYDFK